MTAIDIERLEQAARSVFGHDDGDAAATELQPRFRDRIRSGLLRLFNPAVTPAPGV
jgi:hypothetical protein